MRQNLLGLVAIFIALSGTAIAATAAKNSVTSKSIRNNAVRSADVRDETLTQADIADSATAALRSGPASGDLAGNYPAPDIAANAVTGAEVANDSIDGLDVANVDGASIANGAIGPEKLAGTVRARRFTRDVTVPPTLPFTTVATIGELDVIVSCARNASDTAGGFFLRSNGIDGRYFGDWRRSPETGPVVSEIFDFITTPAGTEVPLGDVIHGDDGAGSGYEVAVGTFVYVNANRSVTLTVQVTANGPGQRCTFDGTAIPST